jgi:hypothetical protein
MLDDLVVVDGEWFSATFSIGLFEDVDSNVTPKYEITPGYGLEQFPQWLHFNEVNRSVYGRAVYTPNNTVIVDVKFTDDAGKASYSNFKIRVVERAYD